MSFADMLAIEQLYDNDENDRIYENLVIEGINLNDICTADELVIIREKMAKLKCDLYNIFGKQNNNLNDKQFEDMCNAVMQKSGSRIKVKPFVYPTPKMDNININNINNDIDTNNNRNNKNNNNKINSKKNENAFVYPTPRMDSINNINNVIDTNNKNNKNKNESENNNNNDTGSIDNSKKNVFCENEKKRFGEMSKNKGEKNGTDFKNNLNNSKTNMEECVLSYFNNETQCSNKNLNENNNENENENESEYNTENSNDINDRSDRNCEGFCNCTNGCCILGIDLDCNDNNNNNNNNSKQSASVYDGLENANINKFIMTQGKEMCKNINDRNDIKNDINGDGFCTNSGYCILGMDLDCNDSNNNDNNNNNDSKYSSKGDKIGKNKSIYSGLENANININISNIITQGKEMDENENEYGMEMEKENIQECDGDSELTVTRSASVIGLCENERLKM